MHDMKIKKHNFDISHSFNCFFIHCICITITPIVIHTPIVICERQRALCGIKCVQNKLTKLLVLQTGSGFSGIGRTREGTRLQDHLCALC
jgi:hypothetical protein